MLGAVHGQLDCQIEKQLLGLIVGGEGSYQMQTVNSRMVIGVLFVTLPTSNYPKIIQIKRRYSIIHSDEYYVRLYYPVPSVIITKSLITKEAGTSPSKVWFPASHTHHRHAYVSARL